ncbi:MAG: APC family permease [Planctomycetes bacterium]|nr:APC family permease [Planctomycetota bacterium]
MSLKRELGLWDLVVLNVVAVVGPRWLAKAAAAGPSSLVLWALAVVLFFGPQVFVVLELTRRYPEEGGLYQWIKRAFGPSHGFVSGWCYWTNNVTYFTTLLASVAGGLAFLWPTHADRLKDSGPFVCGVSLAILWLIAWLSIRGLRPEKRLHTVGAWATWLPIFGLMALGAVAFAKNGSANRIDASTIKPDLASLPSLVFFSNLCFAMAGFEMAPTLAGETRDPARTIPRATWIAGGLITVVYVGGTAAILVGIPQAKIDKVSGLVQGVQTLGNDWLGWAAALLLAIAGAGGVGAWLAGCSRVAYVGGVDRALPKSFGAMHSRHGTPYGAILWITGITTVFIATGFFVEKFGDWYDQLNSLTILVYFIPYLYLFVAFVVLILRERDFASARLGAKPAIAIPVAATGFLTTLGACVLAVVPDSSVAPADRLGGVLKILGGVALFVGTGLVILFLSRRARSTAEAR